MRRYLCIRFTRGVALFLIESRARTRNVSAAVADSGTGFDATLC